MDLSKYQTYNESKAAYNEYYKIVSSRNPRWLHYGLLRIAGATRDVAYKQAGYKDQGISYSGSRLNDSAAVHIEKNFPLLVDFIQLGKHTNMLKMIEEHKDTIMTPEQRMIMLSNIAKGSLPTFETKKITHIRKGVKVSTYKEVETKPNLNQRVKAIDFMNKMDGSYSQELIIRKDSATEIKEMSSEELSAAIKQIEESMSKK